MLWLVTASRTSSIQIKVRSSRERPSPACSPTMTLRSAWMARGPGGITCSSSGYGAASNTRRCICGPMTASARPALRLDARHGTRSRLLHPAANPHGGLTTADAPLIDAENLFRQPGPPHLARDGSDRRGDSVVPQDRTLSGG